MKPLARRASGLLAEFDEVTLEWIPRERNKHADRLANQAMDGAAGIAPKPTRTTSAAEPPSWSLPAGRPTRLVLVRHGSTDHSPQRLFSGRNQLALSELGRAQAAALAARFAGFDAAGMVSSPLPRTRQTAAAIASGLGIEFDDVDGLVETDFGAWEGLSLSEVREQWPEEYRSYSASGSGSPPHGESFDDVLRRVRRSRDELIRRFAGQTVLVVTHVTPIKTLLRLALDAPFQTMFRIHLDTASVSVVDYFENGATSVRLVNDTSHLAHLSA
jgi:probable phosphoglycerate mutase